jgi:phosphonate transport system substrate-binding protein
MHALGIMVVAVLLSAPSMPLCAAGGYEVAFTPFLPVRALIESYRPMREYLERELGEPVTFVSAPDYRTDSERIRRREYAFIVTVANSAYLAHADHGYVPMLRPSIPTRPTLVVHRDSPLTATGQLTGATIAMPDPLAIVSMQGMEMLRAAGLSPARDLAIAHQANHLAAVSGVIYGNVNAAIVSDRALRQMPQAVRDQVRQVAVWDKGAAPGVVYMASPGVPGERRERLRRAILKFANDTAEGRELMGRLGYGSLIPATTKELQALKIYGARLRVALLPQGAEPERK